MELALAAGDALDDEPRVAPDQDAHAAAAFEAATAFAAASSSEPGRLEPRLRRAASPPRRRSCRRSARPSGTARDCCARASISPRATSSPRVMPPKMFTRIAFTFGSVEDQAHRGRDLVGPRAPADVEEVRRLAAGSLHEVHRRHREAGAVDHAADRAVELDEADAGLASLEVGRVLLVEVAQRLQPGVAGERRVVERDLRVEADQSLRRRCRRRPVSRTIASGLISTRSASLATIVRTRPFAIATAALEVGAEAHREGELRAPASPRARGTGPRGPSGWPPGSSRRPARSRRRPPRSPSAGSGRARRSSTAER